METRRELAVSMDMLGSPVGVPLLMDGMDHQDDLLRESFFEALFSVTGIHLGFNPLAPRPQRDWRLQPHESGVVCGRCPSTLRLTRAAGSRRPKKNHRNKYGHPSPLLLGSRM